MEGILGLDIQHDDVLNMVIGLVLLVRGEWRTEMAMRCGCW